MAPVVITGTFVAIGIIVTSGAVVGIGIISLLALFTIVDYDVMMIHWRQRITIVFSKSVTLMALMSLFVAIGTIAVHCDRQ
jgi:hypothetical protein